VIFLLLVAAVTGLAAAPASARAAQQTGSPLSAATPGVTLPLIIVDTRQRIPDEPKVRGSLRIVDNGRGRRNHVHDEPVFRDRMGIEVRGYSSQQLFPKKQYALELRRGDAALLGLPADDDWVLAAPYNDKSLIRNVLAYRTARAIGRYAPRTRFVELVLNGDYRGVYVLTQRIELGKGRVELDEDGHSGGYILELTSPNQSRGEQLFVLPITRRPILYTDPNRDELSARQAGWIRGYVGRFERALYRGGDWRRHLDVPAAVDYVLLQELFKNEDGFYSSTYMHKGRGAKLAIGPVWDFDVAMGNSIHGRSRHLDGLMLSDRTWTERLYRKTAFTDLMVRRWRELRRSGLRRELMHAVGAMTAQLRSPAARNFRRWPILGRYVPPNPRDPRTGRYRATWQAEVRFSRNWLSRRIAWLDRGLARLAR
jgi:hypothetical protein